MSIKVYFFVRENGAVPVEDYLESLNNEPRQVAAVQAVIEKLVALNGRMPRPHAAHVGGKIWELRTRFGNRVFYFIHNGPAIILLDGYTKKRDRIDAHTLDRVRRLYDEYQITKKRKSF
ncbi:MAG: type II toxin-antitoxin system RelE/ParE family toxin [Patescibacteria group bacterium]